MVEKDEEWPCPAAPPQSPRDILTWEYQSPLPKSLSRGRRFRKGVRKEPELGLPGGWGSTLCTQDHGTFAMVLKNMMGRLAWAQWGAGGLAGGGQPRAACGRDWTSGCGGHQLHVPVIRAFLGSGILSV